MKDNLPDLFTVNNRVLCSQGVHVPINSEEVLWSLLFPLHQDGECMKGYQSPNLWSSPRLAQERNMGDNRSLITLCLVSHVQNAAQVQQTLQQRKGELCQHVAFRSWFSGSPRVI